MQPKVTYLMELLLWAKIELEIHTIKRALEIKKVTNTDYWAAIAKEMRHVSPAFELLDKGSVPPFGSKWILCHMVLHQIWFHM
jgi:hypothetical protein